MEGGIDYPLLNYKIMILLFLLLLHWREVSIWVRPSFKECTVYVDGKIQPLLDTSTPSNRRFKTKKEEFELMLVLEKDTIRKNVVLTKDLSVLAF